MRKITLKTVICVMLIVFFGTFIVLAKIKGNVLEGLAQNVPNVSVGGGNNAIDVSYKSFIDSSKGFNNIPGDNVQSQPTKSQNQIDTDSRAVYQQQQQQQQSIAEEQRKQQRDQYLPPQQAQSQVPSSVSLIPQSSQSMPMLSLTPPQVPPTTTTTTTTTTTSSPQVELYNKF